jgi:hypothetical protein
MELYGETAFQLQKLRGTELYKELFTAGSDGEVAYVSSLQ